MGATSVLHCLNRPTSLLCMTNRHFHPANSDVGCLLRMKAVTLVLVHVLVAQPDKTSTMMWASSGLKVA